MRKGQTLLAVVFGLVLLLEMLLFAFELFSHKSPAMFSTLVRTALEATLMSLTWRGHHWARLVMATLFGLGCALLLWVIIRTGRAVLIGAELLYLSALYTLLWSPSVREFLALQRAARAKGETRKVDEEPPKFEPG